MVFIKVNFYMDFDVSKIAKIDRSKFPQTIVNTGFFKI